MHLISVEKQKSFCEDSVKTNSCCIFGKYLSYHLKNFRVPQVGNPWISVIICMAAFAFGFALTENAYFGEIFPLRARGKVASLTGSCLYLNVCVFVVASCCSYMMVSECARQLILRHNQLMRRVKTHRKVGFNFCFFTN